MKRVFSGHNLAAVHHAKNLLRTEGIAAVVKNEFLSSAMGDLPPAECQAEVWVIDDAEALRAEALLKGFFAAKSGPAWQCAACQETCEAQFTQCWACGAYR